MKTYRNNRHLFLFDYDENKENNKTYSDKLLDFFNIDKERYYLSQKLKDRFQFTSINQNEVKCSHIIVVASDKFIYFYARDTFINPSLFELDELLYYKDSEFKNLEHELFYQKTPLNSVERELIFSSNHFSNKMKSENNTNNIFLEKIEQYNITGEQRKECFESNAILQQQYDKEDEVFFQTLISFKLESEMKELFEEIPIGTSY